MGFRDSIRGKHRPDQTAQMRRLVWVYTVRICHKVSFYLEVHFEMSNQSSLLDYVC